MRKYTQNLTKKLFATAILAFGVFVPAARAQNGPSSAKGCLLVRPTEGIQTQFGRIGGRYEYLDSWHLTDSKMNYSKRDLEKLQARGVHIIVIERDARRDEVKQARESCAQQGKP